VRGFIDFDSGFEHIFTSPEKDLNPGIQVDYSSGDE
jgi:hypothetical protein